MTHGSRILIVDDDRESLAWLTSMLGEEGYEVRSAESGQLALASAAVKPPHLILLDIRMPGMSGLELQASVSLDSRGHPIRGICGNSRNSRDSLARDRHLSNSSFLFINLEMAVVLHCCRSIASMQHRNGAQDLAPTIIHKVHRLRR